MDSIKDRNGRDLTEAEEEVARIHRRRKKKKNTQKNCTKKIFTTQIIMMV